MGTSKVSAARPSRRVKRQPDPAAPVRTVLDVEGGIWPFAAAIERFGIAPILLVALLWFAAFRVIVPIAESYKAMVEAVGENNRLLREDIARQDRNYDTKMAHVDASHNHIEAMILDCISLCRANERISKEVLEELEEDNGPKK